MALTFGLLKEFLVRLSLPAFSAGQIQQAPLR
jgi:hypothetical protein